MKPADADDPMALVGVQLDRPPDEEALAEMARCFVEEYVGMGWDEERILRLFRNPFYRGPYRIFSLKGEEFVRGLIETAQRMRRPRPANGGTK